MTQKNTIMIKTVLGKSRKYLLPIGLFVLFETIAVSLGLTVHPFYLFNFTYIGIFVALGFGLSIARYKYARLVAQFGVGLYMLVYLGIINRENMQIEGFFYYISIGTLYAAALHYLIAKIVGPLIFGRGWCGYACWTAMILDFLPFKVPQKPSNEKLKFLRYGIFAISFLCFWIISIYQKETLENVLFISFIIGNVIYYTVGIVLAFIFKDNRAFCKYFCPITVFLKPASYFALLRIKVKPEKCISCNKCRKFCPMNVDMLDNKRSRKNGTECILCGNCKSECPKNALTY